jgi:hypothetical protein
MNNMPAELPDSSDEGIGITCDRRRRDNAIA